MDQNQGGNQGTGGASGSAQSRPAVLDELSTTSLDDLMEQFAEQDQDEYYRFTDSFGWDRGQADEVWNWLGQQPRQGQGGSQGAEGLPEGPGLGGK
jgi:hypothetical protein